MSWWPVAASDYAARIDWLFAALVAVTAAVALPALVALVVFAVRYREGAEVDRRQPPRRKVWLEIGWTVVPFLLTLAVFLWAAVLYREHADLPAEGLEISVVAKQWMFKFQHPGGMRELDQLHVPAGQTVKLLMTSQDVIHSLFIPALRLKQDVLPGRVTALWFKADRPGVYHLHCAEYCGTNHSLMGTRFVVMRPEDYQAWLGQGGEDTALAAEGARLFREVGCSGCHEGRNAAVRAPSLCGVYGSPVALADGRVVVADAPYVRDSILLPGRDIAAGYRNDMPSFAGKLSEAQVQALIAYVKSLALEGTSGSPWAGGICRGGP
jgi:cytochrome c oxidase subunit 2